MSEVKPKSSIEAQTEILTVVNMLTPKPEEQEKAISLLQKGISDTMQHRPGFISANIHKSLDSSHVLVYSQWLDRASFQDVVKLVEAGKAPSMMEVFTIGNPEYHSYEVVSVHRSIEEK